MFYNKTFTKNLFLNSMHDIKSYCYAISYNMFLALTDFVDKGVGKLKKKRCLCSIKLRASNHRKKENNFYIVHKVVLL